MHNGCNIRTFLIDRQVHIYLAGYVPCAGKKTALKIDDDDVGSLYETFAHAGRRDKKACPVQSNGQITGRAGRISKT